MPETYSVEKINPDIIQEYLTLGYFYEQLERLLEKRELSGNEIKKLELLARATDEAIVETRHTSRNLPEGIINITSEEGALEKALKILKSKGIEVKTQSNKQSK